VENLWKIYWLMGDATQTMPDITDPALDTTNNYNNPYSINYYGQNGTLYFSASPPQTCTASRTSDLDAALSVIQSSSSFVHLSVMDYAPFSLYLNPNIYWPVIDDALRTAVFSRNVTVRLLISRWQYSPPIFPYLQSLNAIPNIEVRLFVVPPLPNNQSYPYTRVNHAKYMVSEQQVYVSTNNWTEDYFEWTGGASTLSTHPFLRDQVSSIFTRDWNSNYTVPCC